MLLRALNLVRPLSTQKHFTPVYKFPHIQALSLINRLKLYQSTFTAAAIPASLALYKLNVIQPEMILITAAIGITGCISLFTLGIVSNKFIGFVYLNSDENLVRVAYLDFWGRRKDTEVPLADIIPLSDQARSLTDSMYLKFRRFSNDDTLKINLQFGQVLDKEKFRKVFAQ